MIAAFDVPVEIVKVRTNGVELEVFAAGTGDRLALCLHGFPEHAVSWRYQFSLLVRLGYRVWAPNMRGYGESSRPRAIAAYDLDELLADVAGLVDAANARTVTLIAHDWGAVVAWYFAMRRIRPIERLAILNVPHPARFFEALRSSWRQRARSWYALFFQVPWLPEVLLGANGARAIPGAIVRSSCDPARFPASVLEIYRAQSARPGALAAMLAWYRAAARGARTGRLDAAWPTIDVPTLFLWGERDVALGKELTYGTERFVRDLETVYFAGVSHWLQQEAPDRVNAALEAWLVRK